MANQPHWHIDAVTHAHPSAFIFVCFSICFCYFAKCGYTIGQCHGRIDWYTSTHINNWWAIELQVKICVLFWWLRLKVLLLALETGCMERVTSSSNASIIFPDHLSDSERESMHAILHTQPAVQPCTHVRRPCGNARSRVSIDQIDTESLGWKI